MGDKTMEERVARLEAVTDRIPELVDQLKLVAGKLENAATATVEIRHLQTEQTLQWKKIDANRDAAKAEFDKVHARIDAHMVACAGPGEALRLANEARSKAEKVELEAQAAAKAAADAANETGKLPGRWALYIMGGLMLLVSNIIGGVMVAYLISNLPH